MHAQEFYTRESERDSLTSFLNIYSFEIYGAQMPVRICHCTLSIVDPAYKAKQICLIAETSGRNFLLFSLVSSLFLKLLTADWKTAGAAGF